MKRTFEFLVTGLIVLLIGCSKSGKLDTNSNFAPSNTPVPLTQKWTSGERIVREINTQTSETVTSLPSSPTINTTTSQKCLLVVSNVDVGGGTEVRLSFLGTTATADLNGRKRMNYDSNERTPNDPGNIVAKVGEILGASKFVFLLDTNSEVKRIEGIDDLHKRLSEAGPTTSDYKGIYNDVYFEVMLTAGFVNSPKAVQPGQSWTRNDQFDSGVLGTLTVNETYTFKGWENVGKRICARIEVDETYKSTSKADTLSTGLTMSIQDGRGKGSIWFDPELGIALQAKFIETTTMAEAMPNQLGFVSKGITKNDEIIEIKADSVD